MIVQEKIADILEVYLGATPASAVEFPWHTSWQDITGSTPEVPGSLDGETNGNTAVALATANETISIRRKIKYINIYSTDDVTNQIFVTFNGRILVSVTVQPGDTLFYEDGHGWNIMDSSGRILSGCCGDRLAADKVNLLINGGFDFAQRQAPGTLTTYSSTTGRAYGPDRWTMTNANASVQYQRIDTSGAPEAGLQARFYGKFKKITNAGKICIAQVIEGRDSMPVRGRIVRLQYKLMGSKVSTVRIALAQLTSAGTIDTIPATFISAFNGASVDPTFGANISLITPKSANNGTISGSAVSCSVTTAWQRFSATFLAPSDHKNLIALIFTDDNMAVNDELNTSEADLHDGFEILEWIPNLIADELQRCQRFYQKTFNIDTAPAQNIGVGTGELQGIAGKAGAGAEYIFWKYATTMRNTGSYTGTTYNPSAANAQVRDITAGVDHSATIATNKTETGTTISNTGNGLGTAVGDLMSVHVTMDAEL